MPAESFVPETDITPTSSRLRCNSPNRPQLASGPVDIPACTIALENPIYHFGEAATKLIIKDLFDAVGTHAFTLRQTHQTGLSAECHSFIFGSPDIFVSPWSRQLNTAPKVRSVMRCRAGPL